MLTAARRPPARKLPSLRSLRSLRPTRLGGSLLLIAWLLIGVWFSFAVPAFETPDEVYHYAFSRHLAQGNPLPVQSSESTGPWQQEGSQAPLYYMLTGWLTAGVDQGDFEAIAVFNPRSNMGDPLFPGNKNRMLYSAAPRPLVGANLALHMGRWFSLLLGGLTIWFTYRTAQLAFAPRSRLPLMAALLVAAIPQFVFISASFSNDNMVVVAASAVLYWLARLLVRERQAPIRAWEWAGLGALLGIAALSKLQGLGLFALAGGAGLLLAWERRDWRLLFTAALGTALPALLIAGWWYWRNFTLYGDWTGVSHLVAINGLRAKPLDWDDFWLEFRGLRYSFWGLFGWFNILLPTWFYALADGLAIFAAAGAALGTYVSRRRLRPAWLQQDATRVRLLLLAWIGISALLLVYWMNRATGSQGRLIFPALSALAIWAVVGLDFWYRRLPPTYRGAAWAVFPALLLGMTLYSVTLVIPAAYAAPAPVAAIPPQAQPANIVYGDAERIELHAVETPVARLRPGEAAEITLYLSAPAKLERDYELFIQLLDESGAVLGNVTSHPGWGRNPTTLWEPGAVYPDRYLVPIIGRVDPSSPLLARVYTGFINPDSPPPDHFPVTARDPSGAEITPMPAVVEIAPHAAPDAQELGLSPAGILFGDAFQASALHAPAEISRGEAITLTVLWEATGRPAADYTAFVHLLDATDSYVAGYDRAPAGDRFPTSRWQPGDRILSRFALTTPPDLTPGEYSVWLGLYDADSQGQTRLPVSGAGGLASMHDMVRVESVTVR